MERPASTGSQQRPPTDESMSVCMLCVRMRISCTLLQRNRMESDPTRNGDVVLSHGDHLHGLSVVHVCVGVCEGRVCFYVCARVWVGGWVQMCSGLGGRACVWVSVGLWAGVRLRRLATVVRFSICGCVPCACTHLTTTPGCTYTHTLMSAPTSEVN